MQPFLAIREQRRYTCVPNVVFDAIMGRVTPAEFKILCCVVRFTVGWQKDYDSISLNQLTRTTGLSKPGVINGLRVLEELNLIVSNRGNQKQPGVYGLNLAWEVPPNWQPSKLSCLAASKLSSQAASKLSCPTKERSPKEREIKGTPPVGVVPYRDLGSDGSGTKVNSGTGVNKDNDSTKRDPRVKDVLAGFCSRYEACKKEKYLVQWAKDGAQAKRLLREFDPTVIKERMDLFFDSRDPFVLRAGYTFGVFVSQWNKLSMVKNERAEFEAELLSRSTRTKKERERDAKPFKRPTAEEFREICRRSRDRASGADGAANQPGGDAENPVERGRDGLHVR